MAKSLFSHLLPALSAVWIFFRELSGFRSKLKDLAVSGFFHDWLVHWFPSFFVMRRCWPGGAAHCMGVLGLGLGAATAATISSSGRVSGGGFWFLGVAAAASDLRGCIGFDVTAPTSDLGRRLHRIWARGFSYSAAVESDFGVTADAADLVLAATASDLGAADLA